MKFNLLAFAVPLFVSFMLLEFWVARRKGKPYFRFADSISNLNIGIAERLADVFITSSFYFVYDYLHKHFAILKIEPTILNWVLLMLCTDLVYYWYHRLGHEVNLLWSLHIVHHQSEDYNYTTSVRVTVFQAIARTCFWSILPILGFPAHMITIMLLVHGLYPFFVHTQLVGKLGWLEYIFVTPSHHRVHHASNPQYLDKNYGDIFIFWDKIFGTFTEEKEKPVYGLTKPLNSHSFIWQHFHYWLELFVAIKRATGSGAKLRILFGKPDTVDPNIRAALQRRFNIKTTPDQSIMQERSRFVLWQTVATLLLLFVLILLEHMFSLPVKIIFASLILLTLIHCGAILERRSWTFHIELMRLFILGMLFAMYIPSLGIMAVLVVIGGIIILYFKTLQNFYFRQIYQ